MSNSYSNNSRIAKNTIVLYFRMIVLMCVTLYTSRVILATLGIEDYGIFNVVGGFIGMFAFLNSAMSSCTQRYITFALGKGNSEYINDVFSTSIITHFIISIIVLILAETIGLWFVIEKLVIPAERVSAGIVVYQCSVASTLIMIMSFPFNADIIAHEKMSAFAYISIYEAFAKLAIAFILTIGNVDKLILYAILLFFVQISVIFIYIIYCTKNFEEAKIKWHWNKQLIKEMFAFTGWNMWGGLASALFGQGINILLNIFFGPAINAARGISVQVQTAVQQFSTNFQMALNPQITKTYASGNLDAMHMLIYRSSKFTFFLLLCLILPIILEIDTILAIWLREVPDNTNIFVCLMLVITLIDAVSNPLMISAAATGTVKVYQSVIGGLLLLIVPIAYIILKMGAAPYMVFVVHLCIACIAFVARLLIIRPLVNLSIRTYAKKVFIPCMMVLTLSAITAFVIKKVLIGSLLISIIAAAITCLSVILYSYTLGLSREERMFVIDKIKRR